MSTSPKAVLLVYKRLILSKKRGQPSLRGLNGKLGTKPWVYSKPFFSLQHPKVGRHSSSTLYGLQCSQGPEVPVRCDPASFSPFA